MLLLKNKIMPSILLRRTKVGAGVYEGEEPVLGQAPLSLGQISPRENLPLTSTLHLPPQVQCADSLCLPPRTLILRKDRFDEREDDFYQALYTQCERGG